MSMNKGSFDIEKIYWETEFKESNASTRFPYDKEILLSDSAASTIISASFPVGITLQLQRICNNSPLALFITLCVGLEYLLFLYNEEESAVIGVPLIRNLNSTQKVPGWIPIKLRIDDEITFKSLLMQTKTKFSEAVDNSHFFPLDDIIKILSPSMDVNQAYCFDTAATMKGLFENEEEKDGVYIAKTLFSFQVLDNSITLSIRFLTSLYNEATARQWGNLLVRFFDNVMQNPDRKLSQLDMVSSEDRELLLNRLNATNTEYPSNKTIHRLFEENAENFPDIPAVSFGENTITYRELNQKADHVAAYLKTLGEGQNRIVGVMIPPSIEMIIGITGILKAGGAYLPIDIDHPSSRKQFFINDSYIKWVLVHREDHTLKEVGTINVMDALFPQPNPNDKTFPQGVDTTVPNDLAYIMYTSGSSGLPKAIMVEHKNVVRLVKNNTFINYDSIDRLLQAGPLAFDASTFEIWGALLNECELFLSERSMLLSSDIFKSLLIRYDIDTILLTPSLCNQMVEMDIRLFSSLRNLVVGGDVLSPYHINQLKEKFNKLTIINAYGPTENAVISTTFQIDKRFNQSIPIGKPISNSFAYILDRFDRLTSVGVPGELCVGGDGVSRGYLNNVELTHHKYFPDPFSPGGRIYRTGDMARYLPDGNIDFLGRRDRQVKIRGFRIEPEEIEKELLKLDEVSDAAVVVKKKANNINEPGEKGDQYIAAYFVLKSELSNKEIREKLQERLPHYLIPAVFVPLAKLPYTISGKIDRNALLELNLPGLEETGQLPQSEMEASLLSLWADVLGLEHQQISTSDDFFELGGHSLKAAVLASKINKEMGFKVELVNIFENPTIEKMAVFIYNAEREKFIPIEPIEKKEYYPMSSAQKRIYFLQQMEPDRITYNMPYILQLGEKLNVESLEKAFKQMISRHESLRTSFFSIGEDPVQRIHDAREISFNIEHYDADIDSSIPALIRHFLRCFDLSGAPLLRVGLIHLSKNKTILMVDMHHIISDGTSMTIFVRELIDFYKGKVLHPLTIQYKDYSQWQRSERNQESLKKQEAFWIELFKDDISTLQLPTDYPRPAVQSFEGGRVEFSLTPEETIFIKKCALNEGATLFMVNLSIFNIFLSKLSGQEDIIVGAPVANRLHIDIRSVIGMFVNTLAIRNFPCADLTFRQFLKNLRERTLEIFKNQEYPFEELVEKVIVNRDISRNPIFDVMMVLQNFETPMDVGKNVIQEKLLSDITVQPYNFEQGISKFDLSLLLLETPENLCFSLEYSTSLFQAETIQRFIRYFKRVVSVILENPDILISAIDIVPENEKQRILFEFNCTHASYPSDKTIYELFEDLVIKYPDSIALVGPQLGISYSKTMESPGFLTYKMLKDCLTKCSRLLMERGVATGTIAAIMMDRSIDLVIGILAILKAGGAYLPIDPAFPAERIEYLLEDSEAVVLLTTQSMIQEKAIFFKKSIIHMDSLNYLQEEDNFHVSSSPTNLAYLMYTSGSTGIPKGVMIEHRSVVNILWALSKRYPLLEKDTYLFKTPIVFDVSVSELFGWFFRGGRLAILKSGAEKDPGQIIQAVQDFFVSHINFVPSMFNAFLDYLLVNDIKQITSLKYIFLAGEALPPEMVNKFREWDHNSALLLENIYGPTEAAIYASYYSLIEWDGRGSIPIGKPLDNVKLYILNENNFLQPIGVVGELCIGGTGVARGYWNQDRLTRSVFVDNPFSQIEKEKMYKTGDLARWRSDGVIEFFGRKDHQVKIRGFRIELGEIEHQLLDYKQIKEALVLVRENELGEKDICAYIVGVGNPSSSELREFLAKKLPYYMIPTMFYNIDKIPLSPSGKVDRKLLETHNNLLKIELESSLPRNSIEAQLVEMWKQVLKIDTVGIFDNFFEVGGDSMKAIRLVSLMIRHFDVSINDIFKYPSPAALANHISFKKDNIQEKIEELRKMLDSSSNSTPVISKEISEEYREYLKKAKGNIWKGFNFKNKYKKILVTGSTGYLGAHLIYELLISTKAKLILLVRGNSIHDAIERLKKKVLYYFGIGFFENYSDRLEIVCGDLRLDRWGIEPSLYEKLQNSVDAILHASANTKHFGNYDDFYMDNVLATERLLQFAMNDTCGKKIHFHHISTLSVASGLIEGEEQVLFNEFFRDRDRYLENVYLKSKFEAEKKVFEYQNKGLSTSIYRMGNLVFHSQTGKFQENIESNAFYAKLNTFVSLGATTQDFKPGDMTFVDYAARAVVNLMMSRKNGNATFHIRNPFDFTWNEMDNYLENTGIKVQVLKPNLFLDYLLEKITDRDYRKKVERFLLHMGLFDKKIIPNQSQNRHPRTIFLTVSDWTQRVLKKLGFEWPHVNRDHIEKMVEHCRNFGFFK